MAAHIDFYLDFSSPYGYLSACQIDDVAAKYGATVTWRPYLMGAAMKLTGSQPLVLKPLQGDYAKIDLARCARMAGIPFSLPNPFPVATVAACRAYYWQYDQNPGTAKQLAQHLYRSFFIDGKNIGEADVVVTIAAELGIDKSTCEAALQDNDVKARLRTETDAAIERGVFGSPFFLVGDEPFWGHDRLPHVERWLADGGLP